MMEYTMNRSGYIGAILWAICLALALWSSQIGIFGASDLVRDGELDRIQTSLQKWQESLPKNEPQAQYIASALHNLVAAREGASLIEHNTLLGLCVLAVIALGLATLLMLGSLTGRVVLPRLRSSGFKATDPMQEYRENLQQTIEDLERACSDLNQVEPSETDANSDPRGTITAQLDNIVRIESQIHLLKSEVGGTMGVVKDIADRLQRLSAQCEDNAHFTSATRLEWNAMGTKLRQIKESHNKIKGTSEKMSKQQLVCHDMISKLLTFAPAHNTHVDTSREQISRMNDISKETLGTLDVLSNSMEESNRDVGNASSLVRGLSERAEEIVNIIDVIDDIAEQTNQLALNASIEAARAGEQGQGFAVVAGEVRNLAARSSTATKSITDLLGTIQQEADHASSCLEKSQKSVEAAQSRVLEVHHAYREAVSISRQVAGELAQVTGVTTAHIIELKTLEKQSHELKKYFNSVHNLLEDQGRLGSAAYSECNQLTIHSDRLSRLLHRQYFEISHCDRMVEGTYYALDHVKTSMEDNLAQSDGLRTSFQQSYKQSLESDATRPRSGKIARVVATLRSASRNLEVISAPSDRAKLELESLYKTFLEADAADPELSARIPEESAPSSLSKDDVIIADDQQKAS